MRSAVTGTKQLSYIYRLYGNMFTKFIHQDNILGEVILIYFQFRFYNWIVIN